LRNGIIIDSVILPDKNLWYCRFDGAEHIDKDKYKYFVITYNEFPGCGTTSFLDEESPVAIGELADYEFLVYPNPTSGKVNIRFNRPVQSGGVYVDVYNINGDFLLHDELARVQQGSVHTLNEIQELDPGLYFVHIRFENKSYVVKVMVK
jgi:hypothetical protein